MAKKYAQDAKDRRDERRGMDRYEARMRHDRADERRGMERYERREHRDDRHHDRDHNRDFVTGHDKWIGKDSVAGLPNELVMEEYPRNRMHPGAYLDDTMSEIDAIQTDSTEQLERHLSHQK